jgi:YegS/Rv2252/BmrU family lipid kinase
VTQRRILVIFNPNAGRKAGLPTNPADERDLRRALADNHLDADVFVSPDKAGAVERVRAAVAEGYDVVAAAGGDGTVRSVGFELLGTSTALGILPAGTAMNVARSLGIPRELDAAAALLGSGEIRVIDVGWARDRPFLEMASIGLNAEVLEIAEKTEDGRLSEVVRLIREAVRSRPTRVFLELDGREIRTRALGLAVAVGPYAGVGITVAPEARLDDGKLDVVVFEGFRRVELVRHLIAAIGGRRPERRVTTHRAARVSVAARRSLSIRIDSDDAGTTPIDLTVKRGELRVVAPPRNEAWSVLDGRLQQVR